MLWNLLQFITLEQEMLTVSTKSDLETGEYLSEKDGWSNLRIKATYIGQ